MRSIVSCLALLVICLPAWAVSLDDISNRDRTGALKEALIQGSAAAVAKLGKADGFLGNPKVKIPLPESLQKVEGLMRSFGMGRQADELVTTMNRAAEAAVPEAKALLINAVKQMSVQDAKAILTGGDDAATQYFRRTTSGPLAAKFLPVVKKATAKVKLAEKYNRFAEKAAKYRLVDESQANLEQYVTQKALDGLFLMIADEERAIRQDPVGQASGLVRKVFGAIGK